MSTTIPEPKATTPNETATVLLVDDDPAILEGVADLLNLEGYTVITATNGQGGLDAMAKTTPDIVISDITMPQMDGFTFFEHVRQNPRWLTVPFIFLTARGQAKDVRKGNLMGVDAYLVKPFEPEDLLVLVDSRLQRMRDLKELAQNDLERVKNQMITVFSHELRTPLTYIYGYVNLLQEQHFELEADEVDEMLDGVSRGADRLVRLVEDLMLMVRLDSGVVEMEISMRRVDVSLEDIISLAVDNRSQFAKERGVTVTTKLKDGLKVMAVSAYLADALTRMVDNAIKFSPRSTGEVSIEAAPYSEDMVAIRVLDNGIGFDQEDIDKAFARLSQLNRDQLEQQGLGLGLSIARELVTLHDGQIMAESTPGKGSTFTVIIPSA